MVKNKIVQDYEARINDIENQEDFVSENEYINNNLQLIEKEIEPHSKSFFEIINRDLQQGNIKQGGMMYMCTLESYHRSLTYTKELKQKTPNSKSYTYKIIDPGFDISKLNFDTKDKDVLKANIEELKKHIIEVTENKIIQPWTVERRYIDTKTNKIITKQETIESIGFLKEHILDSPLERGSHFIVLSNSVEGFLRKNRRTIAREVNSKTQDSIEPGKPIIMKNNKNDYFNGGGSW